jgi:hypothetical protein
VQSADGGAGVQGRPNVTGGLPQLSGRMPRPCWATWPGCRLLILLSDDSETDYSL